MKHLSIKKMSMIALFTALLCVSAYIAIPLPFTPTPITTQSIMVYMIGILSSPLEAFITLILYLLLGMIGLPVFSGGRGGLIVLLGPTGGYIIGWTISVVFISLLKGKKNSAKRYFLLILLLGLPITYLFGSLSMKYHTNLSGTKLFYASVLPFLPLDIIKAVLSCTLACTLKKKLRNL
ncbi:MAG: biotin transporter BioY [Lachnospiraceae bacterium]|nr:biotin transporter BioY [Lachnospiraceae bacterium]